MGRDCGACGCELMLVCPNCEPYLFQTFESVGDLQECIKNDFYETLEEGGPCLEHREDTDSYDDAVIFNTTEGEQYTLYFAVGRSGRITVVEIGIQKEC